METPRVLIYLKQSRLNPRGGQAAIGYYLNEERKKRGNNRIEFLSGGPDMEPANLKRWLLTFMRMFVLPIKHSGKFDSYDIVHFHTTKELYLERRNLRRFRGSVFLTSHSPMPYAQEMYEKIAIKDSRFAKPWLLRVLRRADRYAFQRADIITFPCEGAIEPYLHSWPEFAEILEKKRSCIRYATSGIIPRKAVVPPEKIREDLGIPQDAFVVSYVGRHNEVKGYDLLKSLGDDYLKANGKAWFVIAGKEIPIAGLDHERWIELGYTLDPYSYVAASDVFILPNRETYFDVVALEVLSLGKIIVASRTGGNKYYEAMHAKGVLLYDTLEEARKQLDTLRAMPPQERQELAAANTAFFEEHLTASAMFDAYTAVYREACEKRAARPRAVS